MTETFTDPRIPANAFRVSGWLPITEITGPDGRVLNLHNVIFCNGGSLVWFEEPATVCVLHTFPIGQEPKDWDGEVRRYEGTWEDPR